MRLLIRVCLGLLGGFAARAALATPVATPPDTLFLKLSNNPPFAHYFAWCLDAPANSGSGARAATLATGGRFRPLTANGGGEVLQTGYTQDRLWLRAVVVNTLPGRTHFVWSIYNFVDSAALFVQPLGGRGSSSGSSAAPAPPRRVALASGRDLVRQRALRLRAICLPFWLEGHARAVVYLRVESHSGALYVPSDITTTEDVLNSEEDFFATQHWVWLLGLYVGGLLFNGVLYAFLRDRLHLWYGAYLVLLSWFLLMEDGLDAVLLPAGPYRLGWQVGQYGVLLLALAAGLRVLSLFVRLRQGWPRLHRLAWALSGLGAAYALGYALVFDAALRRGGAALAWLNGGREVLLWTLLLAGAGLLLTVATRGRPPQRRLAGLYALTYTFFFLGSVEFLLNRSGITRIHFINPNSLAWGLALEVGTLSVLLTGRFRYALRQAVEARLRRLRERQAAGQRLIAAQDEEREALARELHDALAPGLTALHLAWQGRAVRQALAEAPALLLDAHQHTEGLLRQLRHDVRALSQVLLPPAPGQALPLPEAVALLTETLSLTDDGPQVSCDCDPAAAALPASLQAAAYRLVAELLHNALRHAQARHVLVALRRHPAGLRLSVRDDGRGFDPAAPLAPGSGGLGLRGIRARAAYLRGTVAITSQPGQGTEVVVDLPIEL